MKKNMSAHGAVQNQLLLQRFECRRLAWKKHKKVCKAPTRVSASEGELRVLHEGMLVLNRWNLGVWSWRRTHECGIRFLVTRFSVEGDGVGGKRLTKKNLKLLARN